MKALVAISISVTLVAITACAGSRRVEPNGGPAGSSADGTYGFTANLPDQQFRGKLRVLRDEILVEPTSGTCRPIQSDSVSIRFGCNGSGRYEQLSIRIDRRSPAEKSSWSASYRVQRKRETCSEYGVVSGQQVCIRYWTEYYDASEGKSGKLTLRKAQ